MQLTTNTDQRSMPRTAVQPRFDLIGIGAVNADVIFGDEAAGSPAFRGVEPDVERRFLSHEECQQTLASADEFRIETRVGGSAFNTLHVAGRLGLGLRLGFVGLEGNFDDLDHELDGGTSGRPATELLRGVGVLVDQLRPSEDAVGVCAATAHADGRRLCTWPGANVGMAQYLRDEHASLVETLSKARIVHVTSFLDDHTAESLVHVLERVKFVSPSTRISFDPGYPWVLDRPQGFERLLQLADLVFLNHREFCEFAGITHVPEDATQRQEQQREMASKALGRLSSGSAAIVHKVDSGATLYSATGRGTKALRVDSETHERVDDTGAGDAFAAGFLAGMLKLEDASLHQALVLGTRVAGERVRHRGHAWHEPVASVGCRFFEQLEPPVIRQSGTTRRVLNGCDVAETLQLIDDIAPRLLRAPRRFPLPGGKWTEVHAQKSLHAVLMTLFGHVKSESSTLSTATGAGRIDLLIPHHGVAIEIELASARKRDRDIFEEAARHIIQFRKDPRVCAVVFLVLDPDGRLADPVGMCEDIQNISSGGITIRAYADA